MINYYDKNRFISKRELARLADVSPRTFSRYLATRRHILDAMGISPKAQKLPPQAVKYICEDYCIDLPPDLQDQAALNASPIRDLIYQMQGMMKEDHRFYKEHGFYDFPQKRKGTILGMYLVGAMMTNKKLRRKLGNKMTEGMLMPYKKILEKI